MICDENYLYDVEDLWSMNGTFQTLEFNISTHVNVARREVYLSSLFMNMEDHIWRESGQLIMLLSRKQLRYESCLCLFMPQNLIPLYLALVMQYCFIFKYPSGLCRPPQSASLVVQQQKRWGFCGAGSSGIIHCVQMCQRLIVPLLALDLLIHLQQCLPVRSSETHHRFIFLLPQCFVVKSAKKCGLSVGL